MIDDIDVVTRIQVQAIRSCLAAGVKYEAGRIGRNMRTISESLHLVKYHSPVKEPKYRDSTQLKAINLFVSRNAASLIACTWEEYKNGTVLEHPLPLDLMYDELQKLTEPTVDQIVETLGRWPLVTVARKEDRNLKHKGWLSPAHRYEEAKIEVGRIDSIRFGSEPVWRPISLSDPASWRP